MADRIESEAEIKLRLHHESQLKRYVDAIKPMLPEGRGLILMVADFGPADATFQSTEYVSTMRREDAVQLMFGLIKRMATMEDYERWERENPDVAAYADRE